MAANRSGDDDGSRAPEIKILLGLFDECFERKAWHGPNLKGSIRGLSAEEAAWRPDRHRHSIAEQVAHAAYWKYVVRRRLSGEKRGSFALKGSNWFILPSPLAEATWKQLIGLLDAEHRALRAAIASFPAARLDQFPEGGKVRFVSMLQGIAMHDVYHAGQIQLLKRLRPLVG